MRSGRAAGSHPQGNYIRTTQGMAPGVAVPSYAMKPFPDWPPLKKFLVFCLSMPWDTSLCPAFSLQACEAPIFTEVLSFSADTQYPPPRHTGLSIPPLVPFLGWILPSSPVCPCSVLYSHFFQPAIPAVWGCGPSPVDSVPCCDAPLDNFSSLIVPQMSEFEHWNWRSQAELPPCSPGIWLQLCPLAPVGCNSSLCMEHFYSASSDPGQL